MKQADSAGKMVFWILDKGSCEFKLEELGSIPGVHGRGKEPTPESCPVCTPCCTHTLPLGGAKAAGRWKTGFLPAEDASALTQLGSLILI